MVGVGRLVVLDDVQAVAVAVSVEHDSASHQLEGLGGCLVQRLGGRRAQRAEGLGPDGVGEPEACRGLAREGVPEPLAGDADARPVGRVTAAALAGSTAAVAAVARLDRSPRTGPGHTCSSSCWCRCMYGAWPLS